MTARLAIVERRSAVDANGCARLLILTEPEGAHVAGQIVTGRPHEIVTALQMAGWLVSYRCAEEPRS